MVILITSPSTKNNIFKIFRTVFTRLLLSVSKDFSYNEFI